MRKYFLLSAVALLSISTANATTDYAEVTARATIEVAGTFECDDIDFGTIVVKQNNGGMVVGDPLIEGTIGSASPDFISATGSPYSFCTVLPQDTQEYRTLLKNSNGDSLSLVTMVDNSSVYSELTIPAKVKAGEYTGAFTVTVTY
ncbi:MAG: hypothetical protein E7016_05400 [Alphaproteobacteria bacterium]|nr:hypothetical protein [Alphaproteobacteria bacterium]